MDLFQYRDKVAKCDKHSSHKKIRFQSIRNFRKKLTKNRKFLSSKNEILKKMRSSASVAENRNFYNNYYKMVYYETKRRTYEKAPKSELKSDSKSKSITENSLKFRVIEKSRNRQSDLRSKLETIIGFTPSKTDKITEIADWQLKNYPISFILKSANCSKLFGFPCFKACCDPRQPSSSKHVHCIEHVVYTFPKNKIDVLDLPPAPVTPISEWYSTNFGIVKSGTVTETIPGSCKTVADLKRSLHINSIKKESKSQPLLTQMHAFEKQVINSLQTRGWPHVKSKVLSSSLPKTYDFWSQIIKHEPYLLTHVQLKCDRLRVCGTDLLTVSNRKDNLINLSKAQPMRFKPGPLSLKNQLLIDPKLANEWDYEVKNIPNLKIVLKPQIGKELPPMALKYLHLSIRKSNVIDRNWSDFALSTLTVSSTRHVDDEVAFKVPYKNDECKILMKKHKKPVFDFGDSKRANKDDIAGVLDDLVEHVEKNEFFEKCLEQLPYDPDDAHRNVEDTIDLGVEEPKNDNRGSVNVIKRGRTSKQLSELKRLNVQIIEVATMDQVESKSTSDRDLEQQCSKKSCLDGCVCNSLKYGYDYVTNEKSHCRNIQCMFSCNCGYIPIDRLKLKNMMLLPSGTDIMSNETVRRLQKKAQQNLSKEEKKFSLTVIQSQDKTIIVDDIKTKRVRKAALNCKLNFANGWIDDASKGKDFSERKKLKVDRKTRKEFKSNVAINMKPKVEFDNKFMVYCMLHNLYNCPCDNNLTYEFKEDSTIQSTIVGNSNNNSNTNNPIRARHGTATSGGDPNQSAGPSMSKSSTKKSQRSQRYTKGGETNHTTQKLICDNGEVSDDDSDAEVERYFPLKKKRKYSSDDDYCANGKRRIRRDRLYESSIEPNSPIEPTVKSPDLSPQTSLLSQTVSSATPSPISASTTIGLPVVKSITPPAFEEQTPVIAVTPKPLPTLISKTAATEESRSSSFFAVTTIVSQADITKYGLPFYDSQWKSVLLQNKFHCVVMKTYNLAVLYDDLRHIAYSSFIRKHIIPIGLNAFNSKDDKLGIYAVPNNKDRVFFGPFGLSDVVQLQVLADKSQMVEGVKFITITKDSILKRLKIPTQKPGSTPQTAQIAVPGAQPTESAVEPVKKTPKKRGFPKGKYIKQGNKMVKRCEFVDLVSDNEESSRDNLESDETGGKLKNILLNSGKYRKIAKKGSKKATKQQEVTNVALPVLSAKDNKGTPLVPVCLPMNVPVRMPFCLPLNMPMKLIQVNPNFRPTVSRGPNSKTYLNKTMAIPISSANQSPAKINRIVYSDSDLQKWRLVTKPGTSDTSQPRHLNLISFRKTIPASEISNIPIERTPPGLAQSSTNPIPKDTDKVETADVIKKWFVLRHSEIGYFEFFELKKCAETIFYIENPLNKSQRTHFRTVGNVARYIYEFLKKQLYFRPEKLKLNFRLITDIAIIKKMNPIDPQILNQSHILTEHGLINISELSTKALIEFGLIKCHKGPTSRLQNNDTMANPTLEPNNQIAESDTSDDNKNNKVAQVLPQTEFSTTALNNPLLSVAATKWDEESVVKESIGSSFESPEQSKSGSEVASPSNKKCKMVIINSKIFKEMSSKSVDEADGTILEQTMGPNPKTFTIVNNNVMGEVSENFENGAETVANRGQFIKLSETTKSFPSYIYS